VAGLAARGLKALCGDMLMELSSVLEDVKARVKSCVVDNAVVGMVMDLTEDAQAVVDQVEKIKSQVEDKIDMVRGKVDGLQSEAIGAAMGVADAEGVLAMATDLKLEVEAAAAVAGQLAEGAAAAAGQVGEVAATHSLAEEEANALIDAALRTGVGQAGAATYDRAMELKRQAEDATAAVEAKIQAVKEAVAGQINEPTEMAQAKLQEAKDKLQAIKAKLEYFFWRTYPGQFAAVVLEYTLGHHKVGRCGLTVSKPVLKLVRAYGFSA